MTSEKQSANGLLGAELCSQHALGNMMTHSDLSHRETQNTFSQNKK